MAASGRKWVAKGVIVQIGNGVEGTVRYGLTATKRVGGAVVRNRARRRMRALAEELLPLHAKAGKDYVLIARAVTAEYPWENLKQEVAIALQRL